MEITPKRPSFPKNTNSLLAGTSGPASGSTPSTSPLKGRQTSGVGGFHLSKLEGRATARLNVEASWFDTTKSNSFNPARATKAEIDAYEAIKESVNPTLGSPVTMRMIDDHAHSNLEVLKPLAQSQIAPEALSGDGSLIIHPGSLNNVSSLTQDLISEPITRIESQIGQHKVSPSSRFDKGVGFSTGSAGSVFTLPLPTKRRLYPFLQKCKSLSSEASNFQIQGSNQGSFAVMDGNDSNKGHSVSNFTGDMKKEPFISKIDEGPIPHPSSTLIIDPHRGPPEFQPGRMDHLKQFNSFAITNPGEMMPEVSQIFGTTGAYNASANPGGKGDQAKYAYDSAQGKNHFADQNGRLPQFNQASASNEAYNTSMTYGEIQSHAQALCQPDTHYAASGYSGSSMSSNTPYNSLPVACAAPGNSGHPVTQFKHPNASYGPSGKQNALLEEVNRALGAPPQYSSSVDQNAITTQNGQFYPPALEYGAPVAQGYTSTEPSNNLAYGSHGGYNISESQGVTGQSIGFSGPKSYAAPEQQTFGMQNRDQHAGPIGRYTNHEDQAGETTANYYHQYSLSPPSLAPLGSQSRAMIAASQGYELSGTYPQYGLQRGGTGQANQLNLPTPSGTYVTDGSQGGSLMSGSVTFGRPEALRYSHERATMPKELQMLQGQPPNHPLVLKNFFGHNPFGPIAPPAGPIKIPPEPLYPLSDHMKYIAPNGVKPTVDLALDSANLPFVDLCRNIRSNNKGVLRIINIPWSVNRAEILAFLGRNAQVKEAEEPVHVILDRFSGKTIEAYVEFEDLDEVMNAVSRYQHGKEQGRSGRLGDRHAALEVSSQEALMKALFPKAKNVTWKGSHAVITPKDPNDIYNSGFQGFLTKEELYLLTKCVEQPHRTPYGVKCPQRPFETIISLIKKYPWSMVDYITLADRDRLFSTSRQLTEELYKMILQDPQNIDLNHRLLRRLQLAVFKCPGFTEAQKDDICFICHLNPAMEGLAPYADHWYCLRAIGPKPGAALDVLHYYMALLREATTLPGKATLAERAANDVEFPIVFGNMGIEYPDNVQQMTLAQVASIEWPVIERLLRKSLED